MGWGRGYRNSGIGVLRDYAEALSWFERVVPIRGREKRGLPECRPLGHRNRPHFQIRKADDGSIQCIDYNDKNIPVTFHPNGTITVKAQWVTTSTAAFIEEVLGVRAFVQDHSIVISLQGKEYRVTRDGLLLHRLDNGQGTLALVNPIVEVVHHIRRREANNVRSMYNEFRDYLAGLIKLRGDESMNEKELIELFGSKWFEYVDTKGVTQRWESLDTPVLAYSDPKRMKDLFAKITSENHEDQYFAAMHIIVGANRWRMNLEVSLTALDRCIIAYHKDEVLKEVPIPHGAIRRDTYGWAYR